MQTQIVSPSVQGQNLYNQLVEPKLAYLSGRKITLVFTGVAAGLSLITGVVAAIYNAHLLTIACAISSLVCSIVAVLASRIKISGNIVEEAKKLPKAIVDLEQRLRTSEGNLKKTEATLQRAEEDIRRVERENGIIAEKLSKVEEEKSSGPTVDLELLGNMTRQAEERADEADRRAGKAEEEKTQTLEILRRAEEEKAQISERLRRAEAALHAFERTAGAGKAAAEQTAEERAREEEEEAWLADLLTGFDLDEQIELIKSWDKDQQFRALRVLKNLNAQEEASKSFSTTLSTSSPSLSSSSSLPPSSTPPPPPPPPLCGPPSPPQSFSDSSTPAFNPNDLLKVTLRPKDQQTALSTSSLLPEGEKRKFDPKDLLSVRLRPKDQQTPLSDTSPLPLGEKRRFDPKDALKVVLRPKEEQKALRPPVLQNKTAREKLIANLEASILAFGKSQNPDAQEVSDWSSDDDNS